MTSNPTITISHWSIKDIIFKTSSYKTRTHKLHGLTIQTILVVFCHILLVMNMTEDLMARGNLKKKKKLQSSCSYTLVHYGLREKLGDTYKPLSHTGFVILAACVHMMADLRSSQVISSECKTNHFLPIMAKQVLFQFQRRDHRHRNFRIDLHTYIYIYLNK